MIPISAVSFIIGQFLCVLGITMLGPLAFALRIGNDPKPFLYAALVTISCGAILLVLVRRPKTEITQREGILLVFSTWVAVSIFGSMLSVAGRQRSRSPDKHCGRGGYDVQYRTGSRGGWASGELRAPSGSGKMGVEFLYGGRAA